MLEDEKYTNVRNKLFKLVEKPSLTELVTKHIDKFLDLLSVSNKMIRKEWYMFWNTNKAYDELISIIDNPDYLKRRKLVSCLFVDKLMIEQNPMNIMHGVNILIAKKYISLIYKSDNISLYRLN